MKLVEWCKKIFSYKDKDKNITLLYESTLPTYDKSSKEFEILIITYRWDKYSRKIKNQPRWHHYRYYKTLNSALDAIRDIRNSRYNKWDYPGSEQEAKYPHITPTITIHRYKVLQRVKY